MSDHLDRETSVSVDVTMTGVDAKSRSRFVAAVDRLGGNLVELMNAPIERRVLRQRAVAAGEVELVAAVTRFGIEKLGHDPAFAERTAERYFERVFERQQNKDGVLREALEDLRHEPLNQKKARAENVGLEEQFLDRLEHYAESASSEQLRQKWGRVLSAEVKKPGTFSAKVMRIVDELDPKTAQLFEKLCKSAIGNVVPKCLVGLLDFPNIVRLVSAGLLVDPGAVGHVAEFTEGHLNSGRLVWIFHFDDKAMSVPKETPLEVMAFAEFTGPIQLNGDVAAIPIYLLTDVGAAIAQIFPANEATPAYIGKLREAMPDVEVVEYVAQPDGKYQALSSVDFIASTTDAAKLRV